MFNKKDKEVKENSVKIKKPFYKRWWFIALTIFIVIGIIGNLGQDKEEEPTSKNDNPPIEREDAKAPDRGGNPEPEKTPEKEPEIEGTMGQKNAVGKAKDYIRVMAFSKQGLIEQLKFDDFEEEDAVYGVNNIDVDWNKQAVNKAEDYIRIMAFSKKGLIEQLQFDGFKDDEAKYGVENITVDWKEQAVKKGEDYLAVMNFSKQSLIDQLKFDGFSSDEASYAVDKIGF